LKIGDLTDNRFLDIREMDLVRLSLLSSVDTFPPFQHYSSSLFTSTPFSSIMSDIYTHEPVMDFTNPFLDFDQGYVRPFATILPTVKATLVPIPMSEEELVLPKKPLTRKEIKTRRGYPRGESQGESLGRILLPSLLIRMLKNLLQGCLSLRGRRGISLLRRRGRNGTNICLSTVTIRVVSRRGGTTGETLSFPSVGEG